MEITASGQLWAATGSKAVDDGTAAAFEELDLRVTLSNRGNRPAAHCPLIDAAPDSRRSGNIYPVSNITISMATAVKVGEDAKSRLEELQAEIRLRAGTRVTQQELLTRLIDDAYESRTEVIDSFRESTVPLSDAEKRQMQEGRISSGVETDEDDIDDILY